MDFETGNVFWMQAGQRLRHRSTGQVVTVSSDNPRNPDGLLEVEDEDARAFPIDRASIQDTWELIASAQSTYKADLFRTPEISGPPMAPCVLYVREYLDGKFTRLLMVAEVKWASLLDEETDEVYYVPSTKDAEAVLRRAGIEVGGPWTRDGNYLMANPLYHEAPLAVRPAVADALAALQAAPKPIEAAERRDEAVRNALAEGISVAHVRAVTDLSRARVYQIRDGHR